MSCLSIYFTFILYSILSFNKMCCYKSKNRSVLSSIVFTQINSTTDDEVHTEYYFGQCATRNKELVLHRGKIYGTDASKLPDALYLMFWLTNITSDPTCAYVVGTTSYEYSERFQPNSFVICFCRIIYHYGGIIHPHRYFEIYMPSGGIWLAHTWDYYIYGKKKNHLRVRH